ncbi:MAG TPA: RNA polymerase sigma factor RpoD/SigA [Gemmatimonadaceae bacterium]|nr:RNA polymerase sigma factor RpoD/SigA [Gemmatimonadaceae bacterium]
MKHSNGRRSARSVEDSLTTYLREIARYPLLTREQESQLAVRIRRGDVEALDRLVTSNLRFVVSVAKKYHNERLSLSDLIDEGNLGLMRAAERFDERRNTRFISYAVWWIRQSILQAIADQSHLIRVPLGRASTLRRVDSDPAQRARGCLSLDAPLGTDDDARLLDYLPDELSPAPDAEITAALRQDVVRDALTRLKGREAMVIKLYFGFDGNEPLTLEQIGEQLGVTRERVRQIKERGLFRLRGRESRMLAAV